jgi:HSP20 family protein
VDISEGEKDITIQAEIPGCEAKDIDVSLEGRLLTIKGEKKQEKEIIARQYEHAMQIIREKQDVLQKGAQILLDKEKIEAEQIKALFTDRPSEPS